LFAKIEINLINKEEKINLYTSSFHYVNSFSGIFFQKGNYKIEVLLAKIKINLINKKKK
jgi:hypothetical protein